MIEIKNRRYIGCKTKLIDIIYDIVEKNTTIKNYTFADLFAGTGVVSHFFLKNGHEVFVNDILYSNYIVYKAWMSNGEIDLKKIDETIVKLNSIDSKKIKENYFSKIYSYKYFSKNDSKKIGFIRDYIEDNKNEFSEREYYYLLTSLIYAADKISNTVGHYESYLVKDHINDRGVLLKHLNIDFFDKSANIFNDDANNIASNINADVVYLDPPYNGRQYVNFYHLLENLARWEKPTYFEGRSMKFSRNNLKSGYSQTKATKLFRDLIDSLNCKLIVVSYNNTYNASSSASNNKISEEDLRIILSKKGIVTSVEIPHSHFNAGKTNFKDHKELIYICNVEGK